MAKNKFGSGNTNLVNLPVPDKATSPRQKSIDVNDLFLTRFLPPWSRPASLPAHTWRAWVLNQPVAITCRENLIAGLLALDWKITPVNSNYREELEPTIRHYTKLFKNGGNYAGLGLDYSGLIEWIAADILDTPFGGAAEIGRKGGTENGRVQWIRPLDAGTLYPTLNQDFPVIQYWQGYDAVVFSKSEISRTFMSPHTFIWREGWGMAPPEKVYFAMDLLGRGDKYYANLLLDIPTAGILDLGDMEKSSAEEWITAFKSFVNDNTTSFRVPVLYEHNNKVEFIPFGKVPNDIMFDRITLKYSALVAAAYGMSLSDIGLQTASASGETLAGSIRQERRTRKTGFARLKAKIKTFFDQILPDTLEFNFVDYDDELNVALGKARLASATAFGLFQDKGVLSPQEIRSQIIQDGLVDIAIPDQIPPDAQPLPAPEPFGGGMKSSKETPKEPEINPEKVAPSAGGEGEIRASLVVKAHYNKSMNGTINALVETLTPIIHDTMLEYGEDNFGITKSLISESLFSDSDGFALQQLIDSIVGTKSLVGIKIDGDVDAESLSEIKKSLNGYVGRLVGYLISQAIYDQGLDAPMEELSNHIRETINSKLDDFISVHIQDFLDKRASAV